MGTIIVVPVISKRDRFDTKWPSFYFKHHISYSCVDGVVDAPYPLLEDHAINTATAVPDTSCRAKYRATRAKASGRCCRFSRVVDPIVMINNFLNLTAGSSILFFYFGIRKKPGFKIAHRLSSSSELTRDDYASLVVFLWCFGLWSEVCRLMSRCYQ